MLGESIEKAVAEATRTRTFAEIAKIVKEHGWEDLPCVFHFRDNFPEEGSDFEYRINNVHLMQDQETGRGSVVLIGFVPPKELKP